MRFADIDVAAVRANVRQLRELTGVRTVIAVVKADGYGHGAAAVAHAAVAAGADMLGVADCDEAIALRAAGVRAPILAWLHDVNTDFAPALRHQVHIGVSELGQLDRVVAAARATGETAAVQLKVETGLNRNGARAGQWPELIAAAMTAQARGTLLVTGIFSHLANVSAESNLSQAERFDTAVALARSAGLQPELVHLAASEGALTDARLRRNAIRVGIALYGLSPTTAPASVWGLRPVMTLRSSVALINTLAQGSGVSYGHDWIAGRDTRVALVPIGYADGLPRAASGRAEVAIAGTRYPVRGRIAMDQIVVDIGDAAITPGDEVLIWGDPASGAPTADEWAQWAGTIGYELVTKVGKRVRVRMLDSDE